MKFFPHSVSRTVAALLVLLLALVLLVAHYLFSATRTHALAFHGVPLPAPHFDRPAFWVKQPPAAWFVADNLAVPATYGSFCWRSICADTVAPQDMPQVATAHMSADGPVDVVVNTTTRMQEVHVSVTPWTNQVDIDQSLVHTSLVELQQDGRWVVFTPTVPQTTVDQLLQISITFSPGNSASYVWRLTPADTATP